MASQSRRHPHHQDDLIKWTGKDTVQKKTFDNYCKQKNIFLKLQENKFMMTTSIQVKHQATTH